MDEMNCNELVERVTDCLEDSLDEETLARVLDHMQVCQGCDDYFDQVMVAVKVTSTIAGGESMPAGLEASLLATYREWNDSAAA